MLTGTATAHGYPVAEAPRMDAKQDYGVGKSDALDAHRIATAALPLPVEKLRRPRLNDRAHQPIQVLVTTRHSMIKDRTRTLNALTALVRSNGLDMDARQALTRAKSRRSCWVRQRISQQKQYDSTPPWEFLSDAGYSGLDPHYYLGQKALLLL